ncbi:REP-associated tyrosine transposase [Pseudobythopirellula maris]|nr:transposase [Pseudobythopirellula maris]
MPRKSINTPGHAHELTFSCYHGYAFLQANRVRLWFADSIRNACAELDYRLWAYVFMPNHAHLIVRPDGHEYRVDEFLKAVKQPVSRKALAYLTENNPAWVARLSGKRGSRSERHFWQRGGGYDRNVVEPSTLESMIEYIHLNPVRKGLVERAADWEWSSAGWFEGGALNSLPPDPIPPEWITNG